MRKFSDSRAQLDELLARIAESLQLDETRKERMKSAYDAIDDLLANDEFFKNVRFEIYPQGSVRIGTTVKPIAKNEFDLDIVVHLNIDWNQYTPEQVYNELKRVLKNSRHHSDKIELKNRCIRINYAGDFHMDVLPGCQESYNDTNRILIPDRELGEWTSSNPRGYGVWFINRSESVKITLLEKAYASERLPIDDFSKKKPLQRSVQLMKMYRDKYFENKKDKATSSIILTTIAGLYYNGEDSIYETVKNIINKINQDLSVKQLSGSRLVVLNPVNNQEDFTEKWGAESELYKEFIKFVDHLSAQWQKLKMENAIDEDKALLLKGLFGETAYNKAIDFQAGASDTNDPYRGLKKLSTPLSATHKRWFSK